MRYLLDEPAVRLTALALLLLGYGWLMGWLAVRRYLARIRKDFNRFHADGTRLGLWSVEPAKEEPNWVVHPKTFEKLHGMMKKEGPGAQASIYGRACEVCDAPVRDEEPHLGVMGQTRVRHQRCVEQRDAHRDLRLAERAVQAALDACPEPECSTCAQIACPDGDPLHFHHDGCPSCYLDTAEVERLKMRLADQDLTVRHRDLEIARLRAELERPQPGLLLLRRELEGSWEVRQQVVETYSYDGDTEKVITLRLRKIPCTHPSTEIYKDKDGAYFRCRACGQAV